MVRVSHIRSTAWFLKCWRVLTVRHRVYPVLVETGGDAVHLCCASRLLHLPPLLRQSALHHGCLGKGAVWILTEEMRTTVGLTTEKQTNLSAPPAV